MPMKRLHWRTHPNETAFGVASSLPKISIARTSDLNTSRCFRMAARAEFRSMSAAQEWPELALHHRDDTSTKVRVRPSTTISGLLAARRRVGEVVRKRYDDIARDGRAPSPPGGPWIAR